MPINSPNPASPGNHFWIVRTGNGSGSVGTKIRRFTTVEASSFVGDGSDAIQYYDFGDYGARFIIAKPGMFEMSYTDGSASTAAVSFGIALVGVDGTTGINSILPSLRLAVTQTTAYSVHTVTRVVRLTAGQYVMPYHDGNCDLTSNAVMFSIRRVGIV